MAKLPPDSSTVIAHTSLSVPRFGRGDLPIEYTPLGLQSISPGEYFGPLTFQISPDSHRHHAEYILNESARSSVSDQLYPFEFWPLPRVLSQWRFGRLNEVISIKAMRDVKRRPTPGQDLSGTTTIRSIEMKRGLCFGFFESETRDEAGDVCLTASDTLLLVNACDRAKLQEAIRKVAMVPVLTDRREVGDILLSWTLRMRFAWPITKWQNNIHTDEYARSLGYECALVEGPGIADIICSFHEAHRNPLDRFRVCWKYMGPLYEGLRVALFEGVPKKSDTWRYFVCQLPEKATGPARVLLSLELEQQ